MKKYFVIVSLLLVGVVSLYSVNEIDEKEEPKKVIIEIIKDNVEGDNDVERSIEFPVIEAYAYPKFGIVAVTLHDIGDAAVRLVDSNNNVVSSDFVDTSMPIVVYLDAHSTMGTYYIEVDSERYYAEGVVIF